MDSAPAEFDSLHFSASALPARDRIAFLREEFGRRIVHVEIEPSSSEAFRFDTAMRRLPALSWHSTSTSPLRLKRAGPLLADGDDSFAFLINAAAAFSAEQNGRELTVAQGDAVLISHSAPAAVRHMETRVTGLIIPRTALAPYVADLDAAAMRPVSKRADALRLLKHYLRLFKRDFALSTPEQRHVVATHLRDLVAMAIGPTREGMAIAAERGVRAARLRAVKADILERLGDHDLSESAVAERQRVSPRYIRMLFEADGASFSAFVLEQRLARAHRLLSDPRFGGRSISAVAFETGFGDLSYFNRTFRRRFGASPSDIRAEARSREPA